MAVELSLHQVRRGALRELDARRFLERHPFALVQDEAMLTLEAPDGGTAWVHGAGPGGEWQRPVGIKISVDALSEGLVEAIHSHAVQGDMVIALWRPAPSWDVDAWEAAAPPAAVFIAAGAETVELPRRWPSATVCSSAKELLEALEVAE
jgi:hypothetical protein